MGKFSSPSPKNGESHFFPPFLFGKTQSFSFLPPPPPHCSTKGNVLTLAGLMVHPLPEEEYGPYRTIFLGVNLSCSVLIWENAAAGLLNGKWKLLTLLGISGGGGEGDERSEEEET